SARAHGWDCRGCRSFWDRPCSGRLSSCRRQPRRVPFVQRLEPVAQRHYCARNIRCFLAKLRGETMTIRRLLIPTLCVLAACSQPATGSHAQTAPAPPLPEPGRMVPPDAATMRLSFAPVVKRVAPAVVNVYSRRVVRQTMDPFWQMFGGGIGVPSERV